MERRFRLDCRAHVALVSSVRGALICAALAAGAASAWARECRSIADPGNPGTAVQVEIFSEQALGHVKEKGKDSNAKGATSYDVLYGVAAREAPILKWHAKGALPETTMTLAVINLSGTKAANPFYLNEPLELWSCFVRPGASLLMTDGNYNHFTIFHSYDGAKKRIGIVDLRPDDFFLGEGQNLLAISSERETLPNGVVVQWLAEDDFLKVLKGMHFFISEKEIDALLAQSDTTEQARVAYRAMLYLTAVSALLDLPIALKYVPQVAKGIDLIDDDPERIRMHLLGALMTVFVLSQQEGMATARVGENQSIVPLYEIENVARLAASTLPDILKIEKRGEGDYKANITPEMIERFTRSADPVIIERLVRAVIADKSYDMADALIASARKTYPDNLRLLSYEMELGTFKMDPAEFIKTAEPKVAAWEKELLSLIGVDDFIDFLSVQELDPGLARRNLLLAAWMSASAHLMAAHEAAQQAEQARWYALRMLVGMAALNGGRNRPEVCQAMIDGYKEKRFQSLFDALAVFFRPDEKLCKKDWVKSEDRELVASIMN